MRKDSILIVDDDEFFRAVCSDVLTAAEFSVLTASCGAEAMEIISAEEVDIVLTDLVMPGMDGIALLEGVKQQNALIDVILITGHSSVESAVNALKNGAFDYINKPVNADVLLHTVSSCIEKRRLLEENQEMRQSLKLFEVSWTLSKTLETARLHEAALDAMLQIVASDAGLLIRYDSEHKLLRIKAVRQIDKKGAAGIVRSLMSYSDKDLETSRAISVISRDAFTDKERESLDGFTSILVVPLVSAGRPNGFLIILKKGDEKVWGPKERKRAAFVAEHIAIAYDNAGKYEEAQQLIFVDSLTNLYNSTYLHKILEKELQRSSRLNLPVSLLFIDIDDFKVVNDTNNHLVGSRTLVEVGASILKCVREVDTVVRYGGDEYVVILVDAGSEHALIIAERIRAIMEQSCFQQDDGLEIRLTVSIGISTYPVHTRDQRELIRIADMAMYKAKDISKNCVYLAPLPVRT